MPKYDYVVVGSGLAGLYASFRAAKYGTVALITKTDLRESNSYYAQGGIAAVIEPYVEQDDPEKHFADTITAGAGLCDENAVRILVSEAWDNIENLISFRESDSIFSLAMMTVKVLTPGFIPVMNILKRKTFKKLPSSFLKSCE